MQIINFLDQHSGSLMVIITLIYVVATIGIFRENQKASKASRDQLAKSQQQLEESREQFEASQAQLEETRRLEHMPFLMLEVANDMMEHSVYEIELETDSKCDLLDRRTVSLKNIGNGTAANIVYTWKHKSVVDSEPLPISSVMKGDTYWFLISVLYSEDVEETTSGVMIIQFDDIMSKSYEQKYYVTIESGVIVDIQTDFPRYCGTIYYSLPASADNQKKDEINHA